MRLLIFFITTALFLTAITSGYSASKDVQLSQLVSITASDVRLHDVIDQISQLTGVDIRCGKNNKDWQVRDIPVIVCVKDMPLDKLLRLIADSTHLAYSITKTDEDKIICRIFRDKKCQDDLDAEWRAKWDAVSWDWNTLGTLGKHPDLDKLDIGSYFSSENKAIAKLIASLPTDTLDRLYAGEEIILTTRSAQSASAISELYKIIWDNPRPQFDLELRGITNRSKNPYEKAGTTPSQEQIDTAIVRIKAINRCYNIDISIFPIVKGIEVIKRSFGVQGLVSKWKIQDTLGIDQSERPKTFIYNHEFDVEGSKIPFIGSPTNSCDTSKLTNKLKIDLPKEEKLTYAKVMSAIAQASGFDIVMEDFLSHKNGNVPSISSNVTLVDALTKMNDWWWSVDTETKTVMGWSKNWRYKHNSLVPESLLIGIKQKLQTTGLELDDISPIFNLTNDQFDEWFKTADLKAIEILSITRDSLWQLYDFLNTKERNRAKSETGLLLAEVGAERLQEFFKLIGRSCTQGIFSYGASDQEQAKSNVRKLLFESAAFSDPFFTSSLVLKVKKFKSFDANGSPDGLHRYAIFLEGNMDQEECSLESYISLHFPVISKSNVRE